MFEWIDVVTAEDEEGFMGRVVDSAADVVLIFRNPASKFYDLVWPVAGMDGRVCLMAINEFVRSATLSFPKDHGVLGFMVPPVSLDDHKRVPLPIDISSGMFCGVAVDELQTFRLDLPNPSEDPKALFTGISILVSFANGLMSPGPEIHVIGHESITPIQAIIDLWLNVSGRGMHHSARGVLTNLLEMKLAP